MRVHGQGTRLGSGGTETARTSQTDEWLERSGRIIHAGQPRKKHVSPRSSRSADTKFPVRRPGSAQIRGGTRAGSR